MNRRKPHVFSFFRRMRQGPGVVLQSGDFTVTVVTVITGWQLAIRKILKVMLDIASSRLSSRFTCHCVYCAPINLKFEFGSISRPDWAS